MKTLLIVLFATLMFAPLLQAETRYNVMEDRYETIPNGAGRNYELKYNVMEDEYSYQPKEAKPAYNVMENKTEWTWEYNEKRGY